MLILRFRQKRIADARKEYELNTVTFGTAAAPYLAIRTLLQLATDEEKNHPEGAHMISNFYVDNFIINFDSIEDAKRGIDSINKLTQTGNFYLRNRVSNEKHAIDHNKPGDRLSKDEVSLSDEKT